MSSWQSTYTSKTLPRGTAQFVRGRTWFLSACAKARQLFTRQRGDRIRYSRLDARRTIENSYSIESDSSDFRGCQLITLDQDVHEIMSSTVDRQPRGRIATKTDPSCDITHNAPKKVNERDWKNLRQRIASVAAAAITGRHEMGDSDRHKLRWPLIGVATPQKQKQKEPSLFQISSADKIMIRGANPRTGVISPSNRTDSSNESGNPQPRPSQKWKMNGDQWVSVGVSYQTPSPQSSLSGYRLEGCDVSPLRMTKSSSDWEDQFVVNMPSAKDPNPPIMTLKQIQEYQEWLKNRLAMDEECNVDSAPKSATDAEHRRPPGSDDPAMMSVKRAESAATMLEKPPSPTIPGQYFSPDEIRGYQVSPIEETEQLSQEELRKKVRDSFVGCMEIDRAAAKNPDEILLFADSRSCLTECLPMPSTSTWKNDSGNQNPAKDLPQDSPPQEARRLPSSAKQSAVTKPQGGCKKPRHSEMNRVLTTSTSAPAVHTNKIPNRASARKRTPVNQSTACKEEDDVFVVTPAVTRVRIAVPAQQHPTAQCPQSQKTISQATSSKNEHHQTPSAPTQCRSPHQRNVSPQQPRSISASPDRCDINISSGSLHGGKQPAAVSEKDGTRHNENEISQGVVETASAEGAINIRGERDRRIPSVAELDGLQVNHRSPSPPSSDSLSSSSESKTPPIDSQKLSPSPEPSSKRQGPSAIRVKIRETEKAANVDDKSTSAGKAEERLAAARKHAERLAEARAAFERFKKQYAKGGSPPKAQVPLNRVADRAKTSQTGTQVSTGAKESLAGSPGKGIAERTAMKKPPIRRANVRAEQKPTSDEGDDAHHIGDNSSIFSLDNQSLDSLIFSLTARVSGQLRHRLVLHDILHVGDQLVHMVKQCYGVSWRLMKIYFEYRRSGQLPETDQKELVQIGRDIVQMVVNIVVLGFVLMLVGRAAGYVILIASWIVWLSRPFRWLFGWLLGVSGF